MSLYQQWGSFRITALYWIRHRMTEGKTWVKTGSGLLAKIFHPGSPLVNFEQEDSRENEGGLHGE